MLSVSLSLSLLPPSSATREATAHTVKHCLGEPGCACLVPARPRGAGLYRTDGLGEFRSALKKPQSLSPHGTCKEA